MSSSENSMHVGESPPSAAPLSEQPDDVVLRTAPSTRQLRDVAALLALPRILRGREPTFIAGTLLDALISLLRVDLAIMWMTDSRGAVVLEDHRPAGGIDSAALRELCGLDDAVNPRVIDNPLGQGAMTLFRVAASVDADRARVIVGSTRRDFPSDVESFLCRVAIEQGTIALHTSRLVRGLRTANEAKATFLATMSHELRTPLNAIIGYSDLLQAEIGGDLTPQHKQHVGRIGGAARHLLGLIESILNFARLEAGQEQLHLDRADASQLATDVVALVEPLARGKGLDLRLTVRTSPLVIRTDPAKFRQILLNLLSNALKFTHQGAVLVDLRGDGGMVICTVTDTGVGIPQEHLEDIFEPFRQVGQVHTHRAPGTGLGLSVSRQLARLLGGDLHAGSTVGEGSTFTLSLPVEAGV